MNSDVEYALKKFVTSREDIFGVKSEFLRFVKENNFENSRGFVSTTTFGFIEYSRDGVVKQFGSLAIKHTADGAAPLEFYVAAAVKNELLFYVNVMPYFEKHRSVSHLFPKFYSNLSVTNSNKIDSISIMENLKSAGYRHFSQGFLLDLDHLSLMMRKVADFHASSFHAKAVDPLKFNSMANVLSNINFLFLSCNLEMTEMYFKPAAEILRENPNYASRLNDTEQFFERLRKSLLESANTDTTDPTLVLCHGDFTAQNCLFKYENGKPVDAKMIDMGQCSLSNPMRDIVYLLMVNASKEIRDTYWNYLIDVYYEALAQSYRDIPSKKSITKDIPTFMPEAAHAAARLVPVLEGLQKGIVDLNNFEISSVEQAAEFGNRIGSTTLQKILQDLLERTSI